MMTMLMDDVPAVGVRIRTERRGKFGFLAVCVTARRWAAASAAVSCVDARWPSGGCVRCLMDGFEGISRPSWRVGFLSAVSSTAARERRTSSWSLSCLGGRVHGSVQKGNDSSSLSTVGSRTLHETSAAVQAHLGRYEV